MHKITVPRNDVNSTSVVLKDWLVADRSEVQAGQPVAHVETAKALYDVEAPHAGVLLQLRKVGEQIGYEEFLGAVLESGESAEQALATLNAEKKPAESDAGIKVTKKARELAEKLGVDLRQIKKEGIISEANVQAFAEHKNTQAGINALFLGPEQYPTGLKRVLTIGAGNGLAQIVDILRSSSECRVVGAVDDNSALKGKHPFAVPVLGNIDELSKLYKEKLFDAAIVAISSDIPLRTETFEMCRSLGIPMINAIDPSARINSYSVLGLGNVLCSFVHVGAYSRLGDNNFISAHCSIDHHNVWGSGITLGPGCHFSGRVKVGDRVKFGTGIAVQNKLEIGADSIIASGAIVTNSVPANSILKTQINHVIVPRS